MSTNHEIDLNALCRACMVDLKHGQFATNTNNRQSIFEIPHGFDAPDRIVDLLKKTVPNIMINQVDDLPKELCLKCVTKLGEVYSFQEMCLRSQEFLMDMVKKRKKTTTDRLADVKVEISDDEDTLMEGSTITETNTINLVPSAGVHSQDSSSNGSCEEVNPYIKTESLHIRDDTDSNPHTNENTVEEIHSNNEATHPDSFFNGRLPFPNNLGDPGSRHFDSFVLNQSLFPNMRNPSSGNSTGGRLTSRHIPERLQARLWGHFPKHIDPTPSKKKPARTCKVCAKHKKRSETTWECKKCKVSLHVPECFERYHMLDDF